MWGIVTHAKITVAYTRTVAHSLQGLPGGGGLHSPQPEALLDPGGCPRGLFSAPLLARSSTYGTMHLRLPPPRYNFVQHCTRIK